MDLLRPPEKPPIAIKSRLSPTDNPLPDPETRASVYRVFDARQRRVESLAARTSKQILAWFKEKGIESALWLPVQFLFQVGAVLELSIWQRSGVVPEALAEYPPADELLDQLLELLEEGRLIGGPNYSGDLQDLQDALDRAWLHESQWDSIAEGIPFRTSALVDDDDLVDRIAQLLWNHRHLVMKKTKEDGSSL